jgi:hypothetical protein
MSVQSLKTRLLIPPNTKDEVVLEYSFFDCGFLPPSTPPLVYQTRDRTGISSSVSLLRLGSPRPVALGLASWVLRVYDPTPFGTGALVCHFDTLLICGKWNAQEKSEDITHHLSSQQSNAQLFPATSLFLPAVVRCLSMLPKFWV